MEVLSKCDSVSNEPQITSPDPEERILARRLRIQKRNAAAQKRYFINIINVLDTRLG
jgi:hypothetical protein